MSSNSAEPKRAALAHRDFAFLWSGQTISNIGNQMVPVALALVVLDRGHRVQDLGLVLAALTFALGLGAIVATAIGDRWRRTRMMVFADVIRAVAVAGVAAAPSGTPLGVVVLLVVVLGVGEGLFQPAYQAVVPKLVSGTALQSANALTSFSVHAAVVAGPALAGVCSALWGPRTTLWINAATFVVSLGTLVFIREAPPSWAADETGRGAVRRMASDIWQGVRAVLDRRWLGVTIGSVTLVTMIAAAPTMVLLPVIARERLGGDGAYGAVLTAAGVGALAGAAIASRIRARRVGSVAIGLATLNAVSMAGLALLPLPGVLVTWAIASVGVTAFNVLWITALQRDVPEHLLGRVMALDWLGSTCFMPLGYLLAGPIVERTSTTAVLLTAAVCTVVLTPLPLLVRGGSTFSSSEPPAHQESPEVGAEPSR
uniref:Putative transporter n=1 Tax=uncultured bacterium AB_9 TaxID=1630012 RepID=A0A0E3JRK9_9BACT|nr:putative transporter [uncultured bacterium AB_9]